MIQHLEHAGTGRDALLQRPAHADESTQGRREQQRSAVRNPRNSIDIARCLPDRDVQHARERDRRDRLHHRVADRLRA